MVIKQLLYISIFSLLTAVMYAQEIPVIELQPLDQTICEGDTAIFVIGASSDGEIGYQWQKDEVDLVGETDSILMIQSVSRNDTGYYRCIVSNENGSDTTDVAVLIVDYLMPTVILGPHEVENFDTALFSVIYTTGHEYQFEVKEGSVLEMTDTTVLVGWGKDTVGYVNVQESNANGCVGDTVSRLVIIGNVVPFFLTQPVSQTVCLRDSVSFEAIATGTSDVHYQWQFNGVDIERETKSVLTIPSVNLEDEGEYRCVVNNTVGSDTSDVALLDIDIVPPAEISGENIVDVDDTLLYSINPEEGHTYEFFQTGGNFLESNDTSITVLWDTPGICYVHLVETNTRGCQGDTVNYQVLVFGEGTMIIFLEQPESHGVCLGDSTGFTVFAAGYPELVYQWQKNGENIENANDSIFKILSAQTDDDADYRCIVSNEFGTDTTESAHLSVDQIEPSYIQGPQYVENFEVADYLMAYTEGHVYQFSTEGGNIIDHDKNKVTIQWGASGIGSVSGQESIENGCVGDWVDLTVYIGTTGINKFRDNKPVLYPNPADNFVNIRLKGKHTFRLFDLVGNMVLEENFENITRCDLSLLEKGLYLYKIDNYTGRLIK